MNKFNQVLSEATLSVGSFIGPEPINFIVPIKMATSALVESEVAAAKPSPVVFYPNRRIRRALGIENHVLHGQPDELATAINGVLSALHHRRKSKQQEDHLQSATLPVPKRGIQPRTATETRAYDTDYDVHLPIELGVRFNWQPEAPEDPPEEAPQPEPAEKEALDILGRHGVRMSCRSCEVAWTGSSSSECWCCSEPGAPGPPPSIYRTLD